MSVWVACLRGQPFETELLTTGPRLRLSDARSIFGCGGNGSGGVIGE
jgi:hypothetical protein